MVVFISDTDQIGFMNAVIFIKLFQVLFKKKQVFSFLIQIHCLRNIKIFISIYVQYFGFKYSFSKTDEVLEL